MDENMVENEQFESVQDDTAQAQTAEQEQNGVVALSELLNKAVEGDSDVSEDPQEAAEEQKPTEEVKVSGGIKGRLLAENKKGYEAGRAAAMQELEAKYAERIAKLEAIELREKAEQIAREQNVSQDIAMFLAKNGFEIGTDTKNEPQNKPAVQPRDENGRFTKQTEQADPNSPDERAKVLYAQAQDIRRMSGIDALELFKTVDAETQGQIARGEMDLFDLVHEYNEAKGGNSAKRTPPNIRTNTSRSSGGINLGRMSDSDIDKLNDYLRRGGVVNGDI